MAKKWLVMYEVSQKQHYIFRSNRLRENIGASTIIRWLTETPERLFEEWKAVFPQPTHKIVGGGNALYIFDSSDESETFANELSLGVLKHLPGLELFLVSDTMDWETDTLYATDRPFGGKSNVIQTMRDKLAAKKNRRRHAVRQVTWGIHRLCPESGLPANEFIRLPGESGDIARAKELNVKDEYGKQSQDDFENRFLEGLSVETANGRAPVFMGQAYLEDVLGGERSAKNYVAIVHIDGNAMGTKVGAFLQTSFKSNEDYVRQYAQFTADIDRAYTMAMRNTIEHVMRCFDNWAPRLYGDSERIKTDYAHVVPIRPVVASGDDVSFIAVGQLGIELARVFIQYLQKQSMNINGVPFRFDACAGVAVVRRKFPFWLAYELAERLCSHAKKRLKREEEMWKAADDGASGNQFEASLVDWEIVQAGDLDLDIEGRRASAFRTKDGLLLNRPYYLFRERDVQRDGHPSNYMTAFLHALDIIEQSGVARSKWKALRSVYHKGKIAAEQWAVQNRFDVGQRLHVDAGLKVGAISAYFYDAIETMDHVIRLGEVSMR